MGFPKIRMRRLRTSETMRRLVRETSLSVDDLVYPLFVREGAGIRPRVPPEAQTDDRGRQSHHSNARQGSGGLPAGVRGEPGHHHLRRRGGRRRDCAGTVLEQVRTYPKITQIITKAEI